MNDRHASRFLPFLRKNQISGNSPVAVAPPPCHLIIIKRHVAGLNFPDITRQHVECIVRDMCNTESLLKTPKNRQKTTNLGRQQGVLAACATAARASFSLRASPRWPTYFPCVAACSPARIKLRLIHVYAPFIQTNFLVLLFRDNSDAHQMMHPSSKFVHFREEVQDIINLTQK